MVKNKEKNRQVIAAKRESARKNLSENQQHTNKSPTKKAVHQARRNRSIVETPDKGEGGAKSLLSKTFGQKSSFYSDNR